MFTLGDPALHQKVGGLWQEAFSDPELGPRLTLTKELWAFVRTVADGMRERGELPPRA